MSILSDSEITELCIPPKFVLTTNEPNSNISSNRDIYYYLAPKESFSYLSQEEIEDLVNKNMSKLKSDILDVRQLLGPISYRELNEKELAEFKPMISPFVDGQVKIKKGICDTGTNIPYEITEKVISYGTSSAGYDVRLTDEFRIFTNLNNSLIDPLNFDINCLHDHKGPYCIIPPNSYILGRTIEYFHIPRDIMVVCVGKSTYARCGAIINVTPIEPGFSGNIVIEISNSTSLPLKVYANQGIAQFLFFKMNMECNISYADRNGKYQGQTDIKTAIG